VAPGARESCFVCAFEGKNEIATCAGAVPGLWSVTSETKCVSLKPGVLTMPGTVQTVEAESGADRSNVTSAPGDRDLVLIAALPHV
jgi:hypothetical protein